MASLLSCAPLLAFSIPAATLLIADDAASVTEFVGDDDGDGILTGFETNYGWDFDEDSIPNHLDEDSADDGIPDSEEGIGDADGDGIPDAEEGTVDSDGDGTADSLYSDGVGGPSNAPLGMG